MRNFVRVLSTMLVAGFASATSVHAQPADWPTRPVRIIVAQPAAGAYDRTIRPVAQYLSILWKQPVVVDNRPGAGSIVGTQAGATAAPDGYTLTMTGMVNTITPAMYDNVPFDILKDFEHIGAMGSGAQWLVARSDAGFNSLQDLLQQAKRSPGDVQYATSGAGSTGHLLMELLQREMGVKLNHIPYKGGAPALQDVLAGVVPITVIPPTGAMQHIANGKLKVLAVSSEQRAAPLPEVPTFAELGYKQMTVSSWVGLSAPKGTPPALVRKIHADLQKAMQDPALLKVLENEGMTPITTTSQQYTQLMHSDFERWGTLVRSINLKAN